MSGHWHDDEYDPYCPCDEPLPLCGVRKPGGTTRCIEPKGHRDSHGDGSVIRWLTPDQRAIP